MPRYYYTCPVKTFYMMDNFGVEIIHPECSYALASKAINYIEYFLFKHGKIYVAKESEEIFKPINNDLAQFTRDDGISTIAQYDEVKKAFINGNFKILEKYNPKIIMRDNKQFFMPEVEND